MMFRLALGTRLPQKLDMKVIELMVRHVPHSELSLLIIRIEIEGYTRNKQEISNPYITRLVRPPFVLKHTTIIK